MRLKIVIVLLIALLMSTSCIIAETPDEQTYAFSEETMNWLEWFNSLSDEDKICVNYRPSEVCEYLRLHSDTIPEVLTDVVRIDSGYYIEDCLSYDTWGSPYNPRGTNEIVLPPDGSGGMTTGGYELTYNPSYWNTTARKPKANCYTYALNFLTTSTNISSQQPGVKGGSPFTSYTGPNIIAAVNCDISVLSNMYSIRSSSADETPGYHEYKIALVIDPGHDYHWYRQNPDGTWSHKRGHTSVTKTDASGYYVYCPHSCNRNYGSLNYSTFAGYYIVKYNSSSILTGQ